MRIISLNTWGGRAGKENLLEFFRTHGPSTDIFCLQEMWSDAYFDLGDRTAGGVSLDYSKIMIHGVHEVSEMLPDFTPLFRPSVGDNYGLFILVRKAHTILEEGDIFVHKERGYVPEQDAGKHARNIQYVTVQTPEHPLTIMNFHGLWTDEGPGKWKNDSPERFQQSEKIIAFIQTLRNPFVLCGDFNLLPETESIRKFEEEGLRNLIREFGVTSTRTSFYTKPGKFADYAFISKDVELKEFKILPDEVSDHSPVLIETE